MVVFYAKFSFFGNSGLKEINLFLKKNLTVVDI